MPVSKPAAARVADVVGAVKRIAPPHLAESWDNVGLQFGHPDWDAGPILVALEATMEVLAEVDRVGAMTLVTHHPLLFKPPRSFVENSYTTTVAAEIIRRRVSLIAAHTNYDSIAEGTNGELADRLGLKAEGRKFLRPAPNAPDSVKYTVFTPQSHVSVVIEAMAAAGAGVIGNYTHCTFRAPGTGTYKPGEGANPFAGEVGKLEEAEEVRLECVCPKSKLPRLLEKVRAVHPYEEVAFDVYSLEPAAESRFGLGLVGELDSPSTLAALAARCRERIGPRVSIIGDSRATVRRVALCSGGAGEFVRTWRPGTADVYVTGEMNHHDCVEALHRNVPVLLVGHWESEVIAMPRLAAQVKRELDARGFDCAVTSFEGPPVVRWA